MEPVQKFDEKARVLHPEDVNAEASLLLGAADLVPGDEALGARGAVVANPPEEGTTEGIESNDDCRRELQGSHRVRGQRFQDRIDEHEAPRRREQEGPPPRKVPVSLGDERGEGVERELVAGQREPEVGLWETFHGAPEGSGGDNEGLVSTDMGTRVLLVKWMTRPVAAAKSSRMPLSRKKCF
jgi:hypothetical protein